jgi:hypothetical protein
MGWRLEAIAVGVSGRAVLRIELDDTAAVRGVRGIAARRSLEAISLERFAMPDRSAVLLIPASPVVAVADRAAGGDLCHLAISKWGEIPS